MSYLNGIHLANGAQDIDSLVHMGFRCATFLDGESGTAQRIRERAPDARLVMRLWSQNILEWTPLELAQRCAQYDAQEIIAWNEANLATETGGVLKSYTDLLIYWQEFQQEFRRLCPDKLLHFPAWSPVDDLHGGFWPGADVYDLHCYGDPLAMLAYIDRCLAAIPTDKPVYVSEWNFGMPWDDAPSEWVDTFLDGLAARPRVTGATAFIVRWENPDPTMPNYDLENTAALRVLASWRPPGASPAIVSEGGDMMTDQERQEIERIAGIFSAWVPVLQDRVARAEAVGYGVSDSFEARLAAEMQGAVDGLKELLSPHS